jgi:hypothetical protein
MPESVADPFTYLTWGEAVDEGKMDATGKSLFFLTELPGLGSEIGLIVVGGLAPNFQVLKADQVGRKWDPLEYGLGHKQPSDGARCGWFWAPSFDAPFVLHYVARALEMARPWEARVAEYLSANPTLTERHSFFPAALALFGSDPVSAWKALYEGADARMDEIDTPDLGEGSEGEADLMSLFKFKQFLTDGG